MAREHFIADKGMRVRSEDGGISQLNSSDYVGHPDLFRCVIAFGTLIDKRQKLQKELLLLETHCKERMTPRSVLLRL